MSVDFIYLFRYDVNSGDLMVLREQNGNGKTDITCSGYCDFNVVHQRLIF